MKRDILIPNAHHLQCAAFQEWNEALGAKVWYVYLVNPTEMEVQHVLVVSKAFGVVNNEQVTTSRLRHGYDKLPAQTAVRVEMLTDDVLALQNEFMVTYFYDNTLFDRKFVFKPNTINERGMREIDVLFRNGVLAL
jgi:hypothetical protein